MLSPVPLPQFGKFGMKMTAGAAFDVLHHLRRRQDRRYQQQLMDVIRRYRATHDHHVSCFADLSKQDARTLRYSTAHYLVPFLRSPDHVILQIEDRVRAMPVFRHSLIVEGVERAAQS